MILEGTYGCFSTLLVRSQGVAAEVQLPLPEDAGLERFFASDALEQRASLLGTRTLLVCIFKFS